MSAYDAFVSYSHAKDKPIAAALQSGAPHKDLVRSCLSVIRFTLRPRGEFSLKAGQPHCHSCKTTEGVRSKTGHGLETVMRAFRISVLFAVFLTIASAAIAASKQDWSDCKQFSDEDRRIAGCTRVLQDSSESKENRGLAHFNRGLAHELRRNYDGAIRDYNETLRLDPGAFLAYISRGRVYNTKREHDWAIADFTKAISLQPNNPDGYGNRGFAYREMGEKDRAIADFRKALQLDPNSERVLRQLRELGATP